MSMATQHGRPVLAMPDGSLVAIDPSKVKKLAKNGKKVLSSSEERNLPIYGQGSWLAFGSSERAKARRKEIALERKEIQKVIEDSECVFYTLRAEDCLPEPVETIRFNHDTISLYVLLDGLYYTAFSTKTLIEFVDEETGTAWFDSRMSEGFNHPITRVESVPATSPVTLKTFQPPVAKSFDEEFPYAREFKAIKGTFNARLTKEPEIDTIVKTEKKHVETIYFHTISETHVLFENKKDVSAWLATHPKGFVHVYDAPTLSHLEREEMKKKEIFDKLR